MAPATDIRACEAFAAAVAATGGELPDVLANILSSWTVLQAPPRPKTPEIDALMDAAMDGRLDERTLAKLLPPAATAAMVNQFRAELARNSEHTLVGTFHRKLDEDCADRILSSLRPKFTTHAEAIEHARTLFTPDTDPADVLDSADAATVKAWQELPQHLQAVAAIGGVARQFGCRLGHFPQVVEWSLGDNYRIDDRALLCANGPDVALDSAPFMAPDTGRTTSPYFRVPLRLNSIEEARSRYQRFASQQWELKFGSRPLEQWLDENSQLHTMPAPTNPFEPEEARA